MVPDLTWGIDNGAKDRTATALTELGADWVRMSVSWSDEVEPRKGTYNVSRFDSAIDIARNAGYRVILMVEESPSWAHDGTNKNSPPRDNADLADFMGFLAARYAGKVEAYEVWNEPNLSWAWPSGPNPAEYAHMLRTVSPAIRAADPSAKVVFGGVARNDYQYLEGAYAEIPNLGDYFDVMATHPYVYNGGAPEGVWLDPNGRINKGAFSAYREVRATMDSYGDTKPIWFTEFGWSTATAGTGWNLGVTPQQQADYLTRALQCVEQHSYVEVATWYNLRNEYWENDAPTWAAQLGLMSTDFSHKPAFDALKNYQPGAGGCQYDDPPADILPPSVTDLIPTVPPKTVDPAPAQDPAAPTTGIWTGANGEAATTAPQLKSPRLAVQRSLIRDGRLILDARVARGATGVIRGVTAYEGTTHNFTARIGRTGKIRVREPLPNGADAWSGWVGLVYGRNAEFHGQWVILQAASRSSQLKLTPDARTTSTGHTRTVHGTVAPDAHGSVVLGLSYRTANGTPRLVTQRSKIIGGEFRRSIRLPAGATEAILYAVFPGDAARGIGGGSKILALR